MPFAETPVDMGWHVEIDELEDGLMRRLAWNLFHSTWWQNSADEREESRLIAEDIAAKLYEKFPALRPPVSN